MDIGCSSGFLLRDLRETLPAASIIGADFMLPTLLRLARRMPGIPILQFDLRKCPLPEACLDGIANINVLEHIDRDAEALAQLFRILKPGGWLHLEVPAGPHLYDAYDEHLMHHRRYRMAELKSLTRQIGFECRHATHLGFLIYPLFAWTKMRCRARLSGMNTEEKQQWVAQQISKTRTSPLLTVLFRIEQALGRLISAPVGVRCVLVLRKPLTKT
jgi:SAM-dependent methyltransferase